MTLVEPQQSLLLIRSISGASILSVMGLTEIVAQIDAEIARLQQAKSLLAATETSLALRAIPRGRPKKNAGETTSTKPAKKKRNLSPEGRARIAEAVKRRWALQKGKQKNKA